MSCREAVVTSRATAVIAVAMLHLSAWTPGTGAIAGAPVVATPTLPCMLILARSSW